MRKIILAALILGLVPCLAQAQSNDYSKGHGYVSIAPGGRVAGHFDWDKPTFYMGVGGEGFFTSRLGVGVDAAFMRSPARLDGRVPEKQFFILSPRMVARFPSQEGKNPIEPFVAGGFSLIFREDSESGVPFGSTPGKWWETDPGVNLGGGVNWWFARHVGLRLELRDSIRLGGYGEGTHLVSAHIGLTFR